MNGPACPAEGCDYNENGEKTKQSVRRHINAKADDAHGDVQALRSALNRPDEEEEQGAEGAPDDTQDDEQGEAPQEGAEADENSEPEQQEMNQSSEYEQQVATTTGEESTNEETEIEGQQGNETSQTTSSRGVPVLPLVAGLAPLVVLAIALSGGDDQPTEVESEVVEDTDAELVVDDPEPEVAW